MKFRRPPTRDVRGVRYSDAEWAVIEAAAAAHETYPSTFVRQASLEAARRELANKPDDDQD